MPCLILNQMMFHLFVCPCYVFENQRDPMEERWHKVVKCGFYSSQIIAAYFILVNAVAAWTAFDRMNKPICASGSSSSWASLINMRTSRR